MPSTRGPSRGAGLPLDRHWYARRPGAGAGRAAPGEPSGEGPPGRGAHRL